MYIIKEGEQGVVFQFGKPVGSPSTTAGLYFKAPFIQNVVKFEKKIMEWDGDPTEIPLEGKYILVDTFARWRISDPVLFYKSVMNISGAQSRLDDIINGVVRDEVSKSTLSGIIVNTIFNQEYDSGDKKESKDFKEAQCIEENGNWIIISDNSFCDIGVDRGRNKVVNAITSEVKSKFESEKMGIVVVDIQIKRINYTDAVRNSVFKKIESEQSVKAALLNSQGRKLAEEIKGKTTLRENEITSSAYKKSEKIKGEGDALAANIYTETYSSHPDFYRFYKKLESINAIIDNRTQLILSTENDILDFLKSKE